MNRKDKDRYLGEPTKAAPNRNDQTVAALDKECKRMQSAAKQREKVKELESTLDLHKELNNVGDLRLLRAQTETSIGRSVQRAISLGASWAMIGDRLETTTQAAWSRYHQIRSPQDVRAMSLVERATEENMVKNGIYSPKETTYDEELPLN